MNQRPSGYETKETDWLDVPPPQTDVNVSLVSTAAPELESVSAYTDNIKFTFTQYMDIESVNTDNVKFIVDGEEIEGTIEPYGEEPSLDDPSVSYAKTFIFRPSEEISGKAEASVSGVKNYAGTVMAESGGAESLIRVEPKSIECVETVTVPYDSGALVKVRVTPEEAGANLTITAKSSSPNIVSVVNEKAIADNDGYASFMLNGELPGSGKITLSVKGTDLTASINAEVAGVVTHELPKYDKVTASLENGATVVKGDTVELVTSDENAEIYYTTDGTDPTDTGNQSRTLYSDPIELYDDTLIAAYAVCDGYDDGSVCGFAYYTVKADSETSVSDGVSGTYGETVTLTANVEKKTSTIGLMPVDEDKVEFFAGDVSLGTADVVYEDEHNTKGKAEFELKLDKKLSAGENKIRAEYGGSVTLLGSSDDEINLTVNKKELSFTTEGIGREYDGTTTIDTKITPVSIEAGDDVTISAKAEITSPDVNSYTTAALGDITVSGADKNYYTVTNPSGAVTLTNEGGVKITPKTISDEDAKGVKIAEIDEQTFTGEAISPEVTITDLSINNGTRLDGQSYDLSYDNNVSVGTAAVTAEFKGNYSGSLTKEFEIVKTASKTDAADVTGTYGSEITLHADVVENDAAGIALTAAQDKVEFKLGEVSLGTADVTYTDNLNTKGSAELKVKLDKRFTPGNKTVTAEYGGSVNMLESADEEIIVNMEKKALTFTVSAENREYNGTKDVTAKFTLSGTESGDSAEINASAQIAKPDAGEYDEITLGNITLSGNDAKYYEVTQPENAVMLSDKLVISPKEVSDENAKGIEIADIENQVFTGEEITPEITVTDNAAALGAVLKKDKDYTVNFRDNIEAGTAAAVVTFTGNYSGEMKKEFMIVKIDSKVESDGAEGVYGDEIAITARVVMDDTNNMALTAADTVEFMIGEASLGTAEVEYGDELDTLGTASINVMLDKRFDLGANVVKIYYGGGSNLNESADAETVVTMDRMPLELEYSGVSREYDGGNIIDLVIIPSNALEDDKITLAGKAEISSADAGSYSEAKAGLITLGGEDGKYYSISQPEEAITFDEPVVISSKTVSDEAPDGITVDDITAVFTGEAIKPEPTVRDTAADKILENGKDYSVSYNNNVNAGEGEVVIEFRGNYSGTITKKFTITKADSMTTSANAEGVYGETVTLKATVGKTNTEGVSLTAADDSVEFFIKDISLGSAAVTYDEQKLNGEASIEVKLDKRFAPGINSITAKFGGSVNLLGSESAEATINVKPRTLEYTLSAEDKPFDATTTAKIAAAPLNLLDGDSVQIEAKGNFESYTAGTYKSVTLTAVTLSGEDAAYYIPAEYTNPVQLTNEAKIADGYAVTKVDGVWKFISTTEISGLVITANYAEDKSLISVHTDMVENMKEYVLTAGDDSAAETKVMIWNNLSDMIPIIEATAVK